MGTCVQCFDVFGATLAKANQGNFYIQAQPKLQLNKVEADRRSLKKAELTE